MNRKQTFDKKNMLKLVLIVVLIIIFLYTLHVSTKPPQIIQKNTIPGNMSPPDCDCQSPGLLENDTQVCCDKSNCSDKAQWGTKFKKFCISTGNIEQCSMNSSCSCIRDCQKACKGDMDCEIDCFQKYCMGATGSNMVFTSGSGGGKVGELIEKKKREKENSMYNTPANCKEE